MAVVIPLYVKGGINIELSKKSEISPNHGPHWKGRSFNSNFPFCPVSIFAPNWVAKVQKPSKSYLFFQKSWLDDPRNQEGMSREGIIQFGILQPGFLNIMNFVKVSGNLQPPNSPCILPATCLVKQSDLCAHI